MFKRIEPAISMTCLTKSFLAFTCIFSAACSPQKYAPEQIMKSGLGNAKKINYVVDFNRMIPDSTTAIGGIIGQSPFRRIVFCEGLLYGRYEIGMVIPVEFLAPYDLTVVSYSRPRIWILEMDKIEKNADNTLSIKYKTGEPIVVPLEKWNEVVKANGDFTRIFPQMEAGHPLENSDKLAKDVFTTSDN